MATNVVGFGTTFLGQRDYGSDGSYITTEFVTAFYIPLIPLRSFRVVESGNSMNWLGPSAAYARMSYRGERQPLCWAQVGAVYGAVALSIGSFTLFLAGLGSRESPGPIYELYSHTAIATALMFLSATWPLIAGRILRARAKTRALHARSGNETVLEKPAFRG